MLLVGCFHPAIEMTAGEKEHSTLPSLLATPARTLALVLGKYAAVIMIAITSVSMNLLSIAIVLAFQIQVGLSFGSFVLIFAALFPLAMLFAAVAMAVTSFASTYQQGQNLLAPFIIVGMLPGLAALLPDFELSVSSALIPALNVSLLLKQVLSDGGIATNLLLLTLLVNTFLALLILIFTARVPMKMWCLLAAVCWKIFYRFVVAPFQNRIGSSLCWFSSCYSRWHFMHH